MLRHARSFPPGADCNQRRQIALSLRALFKNKEWLDANTWEGAAMLTDRPSPSPVNRDRSNTNSQQDLAGCTCGSSMILAKIQPGETGYDRFGPSPWHHAVNLNRFRRCGITIMNSTTELCSALWAAQSNGARSPPKWQRGEFCRHCTLRIQRCADRSQVCPARCRPTSSVCRIAEQFGTPNSATLKLGLD